MDKIIMSGGSPERKKHSVKTGKKVLVKRERIDPEPSELTAIFLILDFIVLIALIIAYDSSNGLKQNSHFVAITFVSLCILSLVTYRLWKSDFYYYEETEI